MKTAAPKRDVLPEMEGAAAYPRKNGEPVFDAPWQRRAFGMVVQLHVSGVYHWDEIKRRLIHEIAAGPCATARSIETIVAASLMPPSLRELSRRFASFSVPGNGKSIKTFELGPNAVSCGKG